MKIYPYSSAIIMTDERFELYGGLVKDSVPAQRNAAYSVAEERMSGHLGTLLLPTTITGSFPYSPSIMLDYGYVNSVSLIQFVDTKEDVYYTISGTANINASLWDGVLGIVDIFSLARSCGCGISGLYPYRVNVVYNAGLPTGTSMRDSMLLGLTAMSQIIVNEIVGFGNEGTGDIGVQSFESQEYVEKRVTLGRTAFGSSAKAQFIKNLVKDLVRSRFMRL